MSPSSTHDEPRAVLITGASTGIGAACALDLAARGWQVFAGVRKPEDGAALASRAGGAVTPVRLDVTNREEIASALEHVRGVVGEKGLHGLVNNAGIAVGGPLEFLSTEEIERQFQVNVFGILAVTRAFLPEVRRARGRIVLISSTSGFWCAPFLAAYGASKHAVEALGDGLRVELHPWDIQVALVEPGIIRTPIWDKARADVERLPASLPAEAATLYAGPIAAMNQGVEQVARWAVSPEHVARAVHHALEARRPKTRYLVGVDAHIQAALISWIPDRLRDRIMRMLMKI